MEVFNRFWRGVSSWLHTADLVPIVVIVSTYHYFGALETHDPKWVAFPVALFVDLLHYRSVSRAVKSGGWWIAAAVITTGMAFGLQFAFYSQPGTDGTNLGAYAWLYASLVPVGLAIMAMLTQVQAGERAREWAKELAEMAAALKEAQEQIAGATALQQEAEAVKQAATEAHQKATAAQQAATEAHQKATAAQQAATEAQREAEAMKQEAMGFWGHLNPRTKEALRYLAGQHPTMDAAATAASCNKSTISRHVALLNHNGNEG